MEACEWGHTKIVDILIRNGAELRSRTGKKALALAKGCGYHGTVKLFNWWKGRLEKIEANYLAATELSPSLLPLILSKADRRIELIHRIVRERGDIIATGYKV